MLGGGVFSLISALASCVVGMLIRMHASSKAGTMVTHDPLAVVGVLYGSGEIVARSVAAISFLLLTVPVASHMIGRAAYDGGQAVARDSYR